MALILKRGEIPIILFAITSIIILLDYFTGTFHVAATELIGWAIILWMFSYLLGVISLFRYHLTRIQTKGKLWPYSVILLASFFTFFISGMLGGVGGFEGIAASKAFNDFLWLNVLAPLQTGILSYVGFYMYTIFFRGARTRSWDIGIMMICAILLMLYVAPIGAIIWPGFEPIGTWLKDVVNTGAYRAIMIGVGVGLVAVWVRAILGYERTFLGEMAGGAE